MASSALGANAARSWALRAVDTSGEWRAGLGSQSDSPRVQTHRGSGRANWLLHTGRQQPRRRASLVSLASACHHAPGTVAAGSGVGDAGESSPGSQSVKQVTGQKVVQRRAVCSSAGAALLAAVAAGGHAGTAEAAPEVRSSSFADMPALRGKDYGKSRMKYPDYTETESGLQYKDLRTGSGDTPKPGETVVVDWDGFTIGYYGRIFEARNRTKGGSFEGNEKNFFRWQVGSNQVIPAFEEAILGMQPGGVRRIIVPPELGYPNNDMNRAGPKPTTFSGQRALDFVLRNQGLIDKTLLFDIELMRVQ